MNRWPEEADISRLIGLAQEVEEPTEIVVETTEACADLGPLCNLLADWTGNEALAETISLVLGTPVKIIIITVLALILNRLARRSISRLSDRLGVVTADTHIVSERSRQRAEERADTIGSLLRSLASVAIFGVALIMILATFGIAVVPAIASAGVLAIAIGFGAQSIVEDLLRGVFMLAEDQFGVGDRVDVGTVNGYVERVTLRTTVIRDALAHAQQRDQLCGQRVSRVKPCDCGDSNPLWVGYEGRNGSAPPGCGPCLL